MKMMSYFRCLPTSFVISNMLTVALPPNTVFSLSSALMLRLFFGSCRSFVLMYCQSRLVTSVRGIGLLPITSASWGLGCIGFMNAAPEKGLFGRFSKSAPEKAREALAKISEETGAKAFFPQKTTEMGTIVSEIAHELRNQYGIGFVSSNTAKDGSWRRVKVTLEGANAPQCHVRARTGYFAPKLP